jgi:2-phosphosulfolactate phosphatase
MKLNRLQGHHGATQATGTVVIVDVFRACTTACHGLDRGPACYWLTSSSASAARIASETSRPLLIGKPEKGSALGYHIPNSPTRVASVAVEGRDIIHRTTAGARGVIAALHSDTVLLGCFANASATVARIGQLKPEVVSIVAMGHEGNEPTPEDDLCADYLAMKLQGQELDILPFFSALRSTSGAYFFGDTQDEYPSSDFAHCLELDRFDFAVEARRSGDAAEIWATWPSNCFTER